MSGGRPDVIKSYKDLEVWRVAVDVSVSVYAATREFPREETYGLTAQMRRAAVSIPSNIAEGYGRESTASYVHFLRIAQGSTKELETQLIIAGRIGALDAALRADLQANLDSISRMLRSLIRSLEMKS